MSYMENAIDWFEIPAADFDRAVKFYSAIYGFKMQLMDLGELKMALFPVKKGGMGGSVVYHPDAYTPSEKGTLVYLNANPDLNKVLSKVEKAGGKIIQKKKLIAPDIGYMALFIDTEGNRVALHSMR